MAAFDLPAHPAILGARERSRAINAEWLGAARRLTARFDGLETTEALLGEAQLLLAGEAWISALLAPAIAALGSDPWFEPTARVTRDGLRTGIVLADCDALTISATVTSAAALTRLALPATLVVAGRHSATRYVRGGDARMRCWRAPAEGTGRAIECAARRLSDGEVVIQHACEGHLIVAARQDIVAVTAMVKRGAAPLMREYAVDDGRFVRAASGDDRATRGEMFLSFLRASGRSDAGPSFAAESRHPAFHQRWAAMREWLMLDAHAARPRLAEMAASDPDASIRTAAAATLARLDQRLAQPCPA